MNHKRILVLSALTIFAAACTRGGPLPAPGSGENASYTLGFRYGENAKREGYQIDAKTFAAAMDDAINGRKSRLTEAEMQSEMEALYARRALDIGKAARENLEKEKSLLAEYRQQGFKETASGLQYKVVTEGKGASPRLGDRVKIKYVASQPSGQEFENSGPTATEVEVAKMIPGFREGLLAMKKGAKWKLVLPSRLAYGEAGRPGVAPNTPVLFDVELVSVN